LNSNAFASTPIGGYSTSTGTYGSIYVPASLLTSYQTATNWTYFSSRFVGVEPGGYDTNLISFTIGDKVYQAEEGMTWDEWCDSEYNTIGAYATDFNITVPVESSIDPLGNEYIFTEDRLGYVLGSDLIIANYAYIQSV
jgi:hypothetical protein